jgi:hypothetical protein
LFDFTVVRAAVSVCRVVVVALFIRSAEAVSTLDEDARLCGWAKKAVLHLTEFVAAVIGRIVAVVTTFPPLAYQISADR